MKDLRDDSFYIESESMKRFYKDIRKIKVLTGEEQIELAVKAKNGDEEAMKRLTESNIKFVVSIAKEYLYSGLSLEDLVMEGNIGLMEAVKKFDETRGLRFISYAVWWVRQAILKLVYDQGSNVRLPINKINAINKVTKAKEKLYQQLGREASTEEVIKYLEGDVTESDIKAIEISGNFEVSIDQKIDPNSDASIGDMIAGESFDDIERGMNVSALKHEMSDVVSSLDERSAKIICMYFGINGQTPMTLSEIGAVLGLTNERVRQIKEDSLRKLRTFDNSQKLRDFIGVSVS